MILVVDATAKRLSSSVFLPMLLRYFRESGLTYRTVRTVDELEETCANGDVKRVVISGSERHVHQVDRQSHPQLRALLKRVVSGEPPLRPSTPILGICFGAQFAFSGAPCRACPP